ncbi:MAG TPA: 3'-5' exonuclease, partial [Hyphomicrobiaceae bacterium]|nr:3'-5' exonuclease [Hyphomicrobiaceae bacterium]
DRPIRPSDILILVRRRRPFAPQMVAALKEQRIPVAGADRMRLIEQIAVKDLMVLGDFLTLPEDDLALATVLKSPLFGIDDDTLEAVAAGRRGLLWSTLLERAKSDARYAEAARLLKEWRSTADYRPPFEFFSRLLDDDGGLMRRRMLGRLGLEAADPIDEFLNEALRYDEANPASMQGFLASLRDADPEIKRDMEQGRDEVRVMTVHGSKGLEAPIVFLPDTFGSPGEGRKGGLMRLRAGALPSGIDDLLVWPVAGSSRASAIRAARDANRVSEIEEMNRLLYVAMTRPRDRLYVAGYLGGKPARPDCWYELIDRGVAGLVEPYTYPDGFVVRRYVSTQSAPPEKPKHGNRATTSAHPPPDWATHRPPSEPVRAIPLAPSRLAPLETDETGEPVERRDRPIPSEAPVLPPGRISDQNRFLRGVVTHALLQHLPSLPRETWRTAAAAFVEQRAADLEAATRKGIVTETLAILTDPAFASLFGPGSAAEVPIVADLDPPSGRGAPYRLNGQIDRLLVTAEQILFVDYKTNRPPPRLAEGVPEAYLLQLAAYRLALTAIYPGRTIRAAIVWTDGARLMPIPEAMLAAAEERLWQLDAQSRDQSREQA